MDINQFIAVTDDPEFCLGTTLLYIDTRNDHVWYHLTSLLARLYQKFQQATD